LNFKNFRAVVQRLAEAEATLALQSAPPGANGFRVVSRVFEGVPADYLGFFATAFAKSEKAIAILPRRRVATCSLHSILLPART